MTSYGNLKDAIVAVKVFLENVRHLAVERGLFAEEEESSIGKKQSPPLFVTIVTGEGGSGSPGTILRSVLQKIFRNREINYFFDDYSGATANTTAGLLFRVDALSGIQDDEPPPPRSRRDGDVSSPSLHHRYKPQDQMDQHHPMNNNPSSIEENNNSSNHQHHGSGSFNHPTNTPHLSPRLSPHLNSSSTSSSQHCQQQPRLAATAAAAATAVDDPSQQQPLPTSLIPQHDETSSPYLRRWSSSSSSPYLPHQHKSQHHQATAPTNNPEEHCYYPQDYQGSAGMVHNPLDSIAAHTTPLPLRDLTRSGKSSSGGSSSSAVSTDHYNALSGIGAPKLLAMPYGDGGRAGGGGYCPSSSQQQQQQSPLAAASLEPQVEAALRAARFIQATQNLYRAHVPQEVRTSTGNNNDSSSGGGGGNIISHHHQERQRGRGGSTTNSSLSERMLPMDSRAIPSTTTEAVAAITPPSRPAATTTRRHTSHSTPHQSPPHWHHGSGGQQQQQQQQRRRNSYDNTDNNSESQIQQAISESQAAHMAHTRRQVMDDIQFRKEVELARNESSRDVLPRHHDGEAEEEEVDQEHQLIQMASRRSIADEQSRQIEQEKKYELDLELALKASEHVHSLQQEEYQRFKESEDELIADLLVKSQAEEEEARKKEEEMIQLTLVKSLAENGNVKEEELIEEIMKKSLSDSDPNSCCRGSSDGEYFMNGKTDRSEGDAAAAAGNGDHQDNMLERILKLSLEDNEKVAAEEAEQIKQAMEWSMMEARCYENNDHRVLDDHQVGDSET